MLILFSGIKRACGDVSSNIVGETEAAVILLAFGTESELIVLTTLGWASFARGENAETLGTKAFFWTAEATRLLFGALVLVMERHRSRSSRRNFS